MFLGLCTFCLSHAVNATSGLMVASVLTRLCWLCLTEEDYYEDDEEDDPDALKDPLYQIDLQVRASIDDLPVTVSVRARKQHYGFKSIHGSKKVEWVAVCLGAQGPGAEKGARIFIQSSVPAIITQK